MARKGKMRLAFGIWGLALGYFFFYIPYSALAKALSKGLLPGMEGPIAGFQLLPVVALATTLTLPLFLLFMGGWETVKRKRFLGIPVPVPRLGTFVSGVATAVIIATTTINYTFVGISIVFALLLMRGGVLVLSPFIDLLFRRRIHWYSVVALVLSLTAIAIAFAEKGGFLLNAVAIVNISGYLLGYLIRLQFMTRLAKSERREENTRFFHEETMVAAVVLSLVPAIFALIGHGEIMLQLREGYTSFAASSLALPAAAIGVFYACLYIFGSRIYLDRRENTFCIPLNRCSSLLSGIVASLLLFLLLDQPLPSAHQFTGAGVLIVALVFLRAPEFHIREHVFLFVCGNNQSRSPIAQAFCNAEIRRILDDISHGERGEIRLRALSAGLRGSPGAPMSENALAALRDLGVDPHEHETRLVNDDLVEQATEIVCMSESQKASLIEQFPHAIDRIRLLDRESEIPNTHGMASEEVVSVAQRIRDAVRRYLEHKSENGRLRA